MPPDEDEYEDETEEEYRERMQAEYDEEWPEPLVWPSYAS